MIIKTKVAIVGSGPGGSVTACVLAEAGIDVLIIEEGPYLELESCMPFSKDEMEKKYRNGGLTAALGNPQVQYAEGKCVGGGSEINSGLYHRTPEDILQHWQKNFDVQNIDMNYLSSYFDTCEKDLNISSQSGPAPLASRKLESGSVKLGWKALEVPTWIKYSSSNGTPVTGVRQSMTKTYIPRAIAAGAKIIDNTRVVSLKKSGNKWLLNCLSKSGNTSIEVETVFLSAGAVQTPALLRKSGITNNIGNSLQLHPTTKVIAQFREEINSEDLGVGIHQVKEFSPKISMGCSVSSLPYLIIGKDWSDPEYQYVNKHWQQMAIYYSMIMPEGIGTVRSVPRFSDPLVRYKLTSADIHFLTDGLVKLCRILLEAGATTLFPAINNMPAIMTSEGVNKIPESIERKMFNLMTVHLFSSCPMGENKKICATDSFGRVHGFDNLYIADGSILCTAPGVNPQGSIMAFAARNANYFVEHLKKS